MPRGVYDRKKKKPVKRAYKRREPVLRKQHNHVHYIRDEYNNSYRIWNSWDPGDYFRMIPIKDFEPHVLAFVKHLPTVFVADFPEDDAGETVCPFCAANNE